ncbi:MAG: carboxypeptidase-like regulatory domain-containing protein [Anaerolineales bacterium]
MISKKSTPILLLMIFLAACSQKATSPPPTLTPLSLPELEPNAVRGVVVDKEGAPVEGVDVMLLKYIESSNTLEIVGLSYERPKVATTDERGVFLIRHVPPTRVVIGHRYAFGFQGTETCDFPTLCYVYVKDGQTYLSECPLTEERPVPSEERLWITLEEGESVDLGTLVLIEDGDPLCR